MEDAELSRMVDEIVADCDDDPDAIRELARRLTNEANAIQELEG